MASLINGKNGERKIQFVDANGDRQSVYLSGVNKKDAESLKIRVEALLSAKLAGASWTADLTEWVKALPDVTYNKLAKKGLVPPRDSQVAMPLGAFIDELIKNKSISNHSTKQNYLATRRFLVDFFGADRDIKTITPGECDDWKSRQEGDGYSSATIGRHVKRAKQYFRTAVRKKIIAENPMADVKAPPQVNGDRLVFVERETIDRVLKRCPDDEWRLIIAFARYLGLRIPSELSRLTWDCVDWERQLIKVDSPKTGVRVCPIFPEVTPILKTAFDQPHADGGYIISAKRRNAANLRSQFRRIIEEAGVQCWPRLYQNLRASRATEVANEFGQFCESQWLGHSEHIATAHYRQVTDADYEKATGVRSVKYSALKSQNTAQRTAVRNGTVRQEKTKALGDQGLMPMLAPSCNGVQKCEVTPTGVEPVSRA